MIKTHDDVHAYKGIVDFTPYTPQTASAAHEFSSWAIDHFLNSDASEVINLNTISEEEIRSLNRLWDDGSHRIGKIPGDIYISNQLPANDIEFSFKSYELGEADQTPFLVTVRVVLVEKDKLPPIKETCTYEELIKDIKGSGNDTFGRTIGYMVMTLKSIPYDIEQSYYMALLFCEANDFGNIDLAPSIMPACDKTTDPDIEYIMRIEYRTLSLWYSIMLCLLHPRLCIAFHKGGRVKSFSVSNGKRIVKYVRSLYVSLDDILTEMYPAPAKGQYTRKTQIWHVIGHWVHFKDGRMVFRHGYWKGPLRHLKQNLDEVERQIDIPEDLNA